MNPNDQSQQQNTQPETRAKTAGQTQNSNPQSVGPQDEDRNSWQSKTGKKQESDVNSDD